MPARDSSQWGAPNSSKSEVVPLEVLIPCFERPAELAVTLSGLAAQMEQDFDIILSDQSGTAI
ncbi:glycosyltransferase [Corynebacterium stationis]|nr:glycosyltransferase [Corynebacterium stationis]